MRNANAETNAGAHRGFALFDNRGNRIVSAPALSCPVATRF